MLICLGGVHGNEPSGYLAIELVLESLARDAVGLRGTFVGLGGNLQALERRQRFLRTDLNRHWHPERVERLRLADESRLAAEDAELRQLDDAIRGALADATGDVFGLDLHTTSGEGPCFAVLDDTLANREFALRVPVPLVVGLEEELSGTVTHYMAELGLREFGFEAGQHDDPQSVDRAVAAIWLALESAGVVAEGSRPELDDARRLLEQETGDLPHVVEVRYRHAIAPGDEFVMKPGFVNFEHVEGGRIVARDQRGPILAPEVGMILMPLYQAQGEDGFFIVRRLAPAWLKLSAVLRRRGMHRVLHLLPGVRRHEELIDTFVVDRRWARFLALELFHLLGYRRRGPAGRFVMMTRRPHDA